MKALREILFVVIAAAAGWLIGEKTRGAVSAREVARPENGSSKAFAAQPSSDEALAPVLSAIFTHGDLRALAQLGPLLEALDSSQMAALLDRLDRLPGPERETLLPRFLASWTERDPQAATAWMEPRLARFAKDPEAINGILHFVTNLVDAWAENAPDLALEYARQHRWCGLTQHLVAVTNYRIRHQDRTQRLAVLRGFPEGKERAKIVTSFFFSWVQSDRAAALAAAAALPPGPERTGGLGEVLARWAERKPEEAFAKTQELGIDEPAILAMIAKEAAKSDPAATARWLEMQDSALLPQLGGLIVARWVEKNPAAALDWAQAHGVSLLDGLPNRLIESLGQMTAGHVYEMHNVPFAKAVREAPEKTLAWVRGLPVGAERERFCEIAIRSGIAPADTQSLLAELPPDAAARAAGHIAAGLSRDVEKARPWLEALPAGPIREAAWSAIGAARTEPLELPAGADRDAMLSGMATARATSEPAKALDRVLEISNVSLRRRTFDDVFWLLRRGEVEVGEGITMGGAPAAALSAADEWLKTANVPKEWKQPWLR